MITLRKTLVALIVLAPLAATPPQAQAKGPSWKKATRAINKAGRQADPFRHNSYANKATKKFDKATLPYREALVMKILAGL